MIAKGTTAGAIVLAAAKVGVRVDVRDVRPTRDGGQRVRFGLRLGDAISTTGKKKDARRKYQRVGVAGWNAAGATRRIASVCWHGHREFFRALFAGSPSARVQTAQTMTAVPGKWYTADNFESVYQNTGHVNVGSQYAPLAYADACTCDDVDDGADVAMVPQGKYQMGGGIR
jgi:hypothetical protein